MSLKPYYSCAELAAMKLPGLPTCPKNMRIRVTAEGWASRQVPCKGGKSGIRTEYQPPADIYNLILSACSPAAIVAAPADTAVAEIKPPQNLAALDQDQRDCDIARARLVAFIEGYRGANKSGMVRPAIAYLNTERAAGRLSPALSWAFDNAWSKKRPGQQLNAKTFYNWLTLKQQTGSFAPGKRQKDYSVKPWHPLLFDLMQRPQGSCKKWVADQIEAQWEPSWGEKPKDFYNVLCRSLSEKISQSDLLKGRWSGSQLRSKKFYQHRTTEGLAPADEAHGDGWCTHHTWPHPVTKEFVTYEIWHFHDLATKFTTPPGIGMSEKFEVISKGLENYVRVFGQVLIVQMDSTKVVKGSDKFTKAQHSLETRLGCTIVHPVAVGNSQANGICENFNTYLDRRSREMATYSGKGMDTLTYRRVGKITAKMAKAETEDEYRVLKKEAERMGKGIVHDSAEEGIAWINRVVDEANDKPNSSLKKIRDPDTGKLRHQTPREALIEHIVNGWEPSALTEAQIVDIFRPHTVCKVTRETVSPYGGMRYKNSDLLSHWTGKEVIVAYDIHDYNQVWVKDMNGALICVAKFVEATPYRAQSAYDAAEEKRAKARIRLCENKIETIKARTPGAALEGEFERVENISDFISFNTEMVKPEPMLTIADFEVVKEMKKEKEPTYADTVMMLWQDEQDKLAGETSKEAATGS